MINKSSLIKHVDFVFLDILCLIISFIFGNYIRHKTFILNISYNKLLLLVVLFQIVIIFLYEPFTNVLKRGYLKEFFKTIKYDLTNLIVVALYLFVFKETAIYSRLFVLYTYLIYFFSSYFTRCLYKRYLIKNLDKLKQNSKKSLIIISDNKKYKENVDRLSKSYDYCISGICILNSKKIGKEYNGYKIVANNKNVLEYVCRNHVDDVFFGIDISQVDSNIVKGLANAGITRHFIIPSEYQFEGKIDRLESYNVITSNYKTYTQKEFFLKRLIDIIGAIVGSIFTIILAIFVGFIIKVKSPEGPVFYTSERIGLNGKRFKMYKFRSMIPNADSLKEKLKEENIIKDGMMFKIENDPRIIPGIGNFIRKTSIDEFPQFFNVLKGDMSLVGTRPPTPDEWEKYKPEHRIRLFMKPGITGLWQISGRSSITDFDEVVKLDKEYIDNWDISLDIKIILKTIIYIFSKKDDAM